MEKPGSCTGKLGSLLCDVKNKAYDFCVLLNIILHVGFLALSICLNQLQDVTAIATPAIELSFPEQTNYPPKQCLCVSNRTGTNTSLLFPFVHDLCRRWQCRAGNGFHLLKSLHPPGYRKILEAPTTLYISFCLPAVLPFSNLREMAVQVWCLVPGESSGKAFEPRSVVSPGQNQPA